MIDVKLQLLTIVFPMLLYAAETWTINKEDKKLLAVEIIIIIELCSAPFTIRSIDQRCITVNVLRLQVLQTYFGSEMARSKN